MVEQILEVVERELGKEAAKEVESWYDDSDWLTCLEMAGVDNWEGWVYAIDIRDGNTDEY